MSDMTDAELREWARDNLVGIDVEALRTFERQWRNDPPSGMTKRVVQAIRQVLAALDQGDTP